MEEIIFQNGNKIKVLDVEGEAIRGKIRYFEISLDQSEWDAIKALLYRAELNKVNLKNFNGSFKSLIEKIDKATEK